MNGRLILRLGFVLAFGGCVDALIGDDGYRDSDTTEGNKDSDMDMDTGVDTVSDTDIETDTDGNAVTSGTLAHQWRFNENLNDEVGNSNAVIVTPTGAAGGNALLTGSEIYLSGGSYDAAEWISLGTGLLNEFGGGAVTIELFATLWSVNFFSRIFEFGGGRYEYLLMTWVVESDAESDLVRWWDVSQVSQLDTNAPYTLGREYHILMTIEPGGGTDGTMRITWYTARSDATDIGPAAGFIETPDPLSGFRDIDCWLGKSHDDPDSVSNASYNDVRIWSGALTEADIIKLHRLGPDM